MNGKTPPSKLVFFDFTLDVKAGELHRAGKKVSLQEQPLQVLRILAERAGEVVSREELREALWQGNVLMDADDALSTAVRKIRQALEDSKDAPRFIETLPKRGYRFIAPVGSVAAKVVNWERRAVLVCLGVIGGAAWLGRPRELPKAIGYRQLTQDGSPKASGTLLSDGSRLFYSWGQDLFSFEEKAGIQRVLSGWEPHDIGGTGILAKPYGMVENQLWMVPWKGGDAKLLQADCNAAAWGPDGTTYAFAAGGSVFCSDRVGELGRLEGKVISLKWHADGKRIRAGVRASHGDSIWELSAGGKGPRKVATDGINGTWVEEGRYFVLGPNPGEQELRILREADGAMGVLTDGLIGFGHPTTLNRREEIFSIGLREQGEVLRYDAKTSQFKLLGGELSADGLSFSPDGKELAYSGWPQRGLWKSLANGTGGRQLTEPDWQAMMPRWSPDGEWICFMGKLKAGRKWDLYRIRAAGGSPEVLHADESSMANPGWSPDGGQMVFARAAWTMGFAAGSGGIRILDLKTRAVREVAGSSELWSPKWSADGKYLLAETLTSRNILVWEFARQSWREVCKADSEIGYAWWSADSKWIYFNEAGGAGRNAKVSRVEVGSGRIETVLELSDVRMAHSLGAWFGLGPHDELLFLRDTSRMDLYAITIEKS